MIDIAVSRQLSGPGGAMTLRFDAKIETGQFVCIYGPSGAGKTSVLRMLAGLLTPGDGHVIVDGKVWFDKNDRINLTPQRRSIGMVFQEYSLFPNMTVRGNLEFALDKDKSPELVDELLKMTELEQLQHQRPTLLSGGQKQRVALARALIRRPALMLLDEPLSALDSEMRAKLQDYISTIHQTFKLTTIMVSHDLAEISRMSERVIVLEDGNIARDGSPAEVLPKVWTG